ncbi:MAG: hypothetical protein KGK05_01670 [Xanthomonadaceae bacterium]|nr:hypothetical protein [Xanthomonadaceae bacterium]
MVDQHVAHVQGGEREEMCAILPIDIRIAQTQETLVHQCRRIQRGRARAAQTLARQRAQVRVDQFGQLRQRVGIAFAPGVQQRCDRRLRVEHAYSVCEYRQAAIPGTIPACIRNARNA